MRSKRHLRNAHRNLVNPSLLRAEPLEKRELLAADFNWLAVPPGNDGVCPVECELVDVDRDGPRESALGNMSQNGANWVGMRARRGNTQQVGPVQDADVTMNGELSEADAVGVRYLREEEKLAHDVYSTLGEIWGSPIFSRIAQAESRHMAAVGQLIDNYGLEDPIGDNGRGEFENQVLSDLYRQLVADGSKSPVDAYKVGALIEELDIKDLNEASAENPDVARVYAALERGSRNHLRAFDARIVAAGEEYVAIHLSQMEYDAIADSNVERGNDQQAPGRQDRVKMHGQYVEMDARLYRLGRFGDSGAGRRRSSGDADGDRDRDRLSNDGDLGDASQTATIRDRLFANMGSQRGTRRLG